MVLINVLSYIGYYEYGNIELVEGFVIEEQHIVAWMDKQQLHIYLVLGAVTKLCMRRIILAYAKEKNPSHPSKGSYGSSLKINEDINSDASQYCPPPQFVNLGMK